MQRREFLFRSLAAACGLPALLRATRSNALEAPAGGDAYARYIRTSPDFSRVRQDKSWLSKAWPGWIYMPWTYQWSIGYTDASGQWSLSHGYNGAFLDGNGGGPTADGDKWAWIQKFKLRFYLDHTARKGYLHLWDGNKKRDHLNELHSTGVRPVPINAALKTKLQGFIAQNIEQVKSSPFRAAYALDDETSWGHFVHPTMWRATDDDSLYPAWLAQVYGADAAPRREGWISYDDVYPQLSDWSLRTFDASALLDQWTFNDAIWANLLGDLVSYANSVDPATPCGIVGGQSPSPFGGYDYARLLRKIQFLEAYNLGSSQSIIRSLNPNNALPTVTSVFHASAADDIWQTWYYLAHGNRGHIGWVENWFDGQTPKEWHEQVAPHSLEAGQKIGPLLQDATWQHDGVTLLYQHPSIQLGWVLDAQAHRKTWRNREADHRLGASHLVRQAWENMLRDEGVQFSWLSYVDLIQSGVPKEYHTLILPACLCLSDAEARAIRQFCERGGTLIADYLPGLWDQHGRGRTAGGALDALFGARHDPNLRSTDLWSGNELWCEVNQDNNYDWKSYTEFLTSGNTCLQDASGFHKAVRNMPTETVARVGLGTAVLLNLSPQWYNALRTQGFEAAKARQTFLRHLPAKARRWVEIENAGAREFGYEITVWRKPNGRKVLFLLANLEVNGSQTGGGSAVGLQTDTLPVTLKFAAPVKSVRDERAGKELGGGTRFALNWTRNEAVVLSFA